MNIEDRLVYTQKCLEDLKKRWPAHSVKPQMVDEMEKLEEEITFLKTLQRSGQKELPEEVTKNDC